MNVEDMDKKQLRNAANKLGVAWEKGFSEEKLRKLITRKVKVAEEVTAKPNAAGAAFDTAQRAPTAMRVDPKTKKSVKVPTGCFGWFYNPEPKDGEVNCDRDCPHAKACRKLSKNADEVLSQLVEEEKLEEEIAAVGDDDVVEAKKVAGKKGKKASAANVADEEEHMGDSLTGSSKLKVLIDRSYALAIDDKDLRTLYKAVTKAFPQDTVTKASAIAKVIAEATGEDEAAVPTIIADILPQMIENEELEVV